MILKKKAGVYIRPAQMRPSSPSITVSPYTVDLILKPIGNIGE